MKLAPDPVPRSIPSARFAVRRALFFILLSMPFLARGAELPAVDGVILVIADGTSTELLTATRVWKHGVEGRLALEELPRTAFVRTYSANGMVTDSSAAATAMARGQKLENAAVGITNPPGESIVALAKQAGWNTAIVTDDEVQGGTPSPFYAATETRRRLDIIAGLALDALGDTVDILVGGGSRWYEPDVPGEKDKVQRQLFINRGKLANSTIRHFTSWEKFQALEDLSRPVLATLWPGVAPFYADGKRTVRLADLADKVLSLLQSEQKPYLLVLEAALPDKGAHQNSARRAMTEVLELDETISRLRRQISPNTLLLVTTDHGTGGLSFNGYVPSHLSGDILLKKNPLTRHPILSWSSGPGLQDPPLQPDPLAPDATQPSLTHWKSALHTGGDVWLLGQGPGSEAVHGFLDNTDIYRIMRNVIVPAPK